MPHARSTGACSRHEGVIVMSNLHPMSEGARKCLEAILAHKVEHDEYPTVRELMERMNLRSEQSVHRYLHVLSDRGHIERIPHKARGIRIREDRPNEPDYGLAIEHCRHYVEWMEGTHIKTLMESERIPADNEMDALEWARSGAKTNIQTVRFYRDARRAIGNALEYCRL